MSDSPIDDWKSSWNGPEKDIEDWILSEAAAHSMPDRRLGVSEVFSIKGTSSDRSTANQYVPFILFISSLTIFWES
jgi:hypothetical protein